MLRFIFNVIHTPCSCLSHTSFVEQMEIKFTCCAFLLPLQKFINTLQFSANVCIFISNLRAQIQLKSHIIGIHMNQHQANFKDANSFMFPYIIQLSTSWNLNTLCFKARFSNTGPKKCVSLQKLFNVFLFILVVGKYVMVAFIFTLYNLVYRIP